MPDGKDPLKPTSVGKPTPRGPAPLMNAPVDPTKTVTAIARAPKFVGHRTRFVANPEGEPGFGTRSVDAGIAPDQGVGLFSNDPRGGSEKKLNPPARGGSDHANPVSMGQAKPQPLARGGVNAERPKVVSTHTPKDGGSQIPPAESQGAVPPVTSSGSTQPSRGKNFLWMPMVTTKPVVPQMAPRKLAPLPAAPANPVPATPAPAPPTPVANRKQFLADRRAMLVDIVEKRNQAKRAAMLDLLAKRAGELPQEKPSPSKGARGSHPAASSLRASGAKLKPSAPVQRGPKAEPVRQQKPPTPINAAVAPKAAPPARPREASLAPTEGSRVVYTVKTPQFGDVAIRENAAPGKRPTYSVHVADAKHWTSAKHAAKAMGARVEGGVAHFDSPNAAREFAESLAIDPTRRRVRENDLGQAVVEDLDHADEFEIGGEPSTPSPKEPKASAGIKRARSGKPSPRPENASPATAAEEARSGGPPSHATDATAKASPTKSSTTPTTAPATSAGGTASTSTNATGSSPASRANPSVAGSNPPSAPSGISPSRQILEAMRKADLATSSGAPITFDRLRPHLTGPLADKDTFDKAVLQMGRDGLVSLHRHDFPAGQSEEAVRQMVPDGQGGQYFTISRRSTTPKATGGGVEPSTPSSISPNRQQPAASPAASAAVPASSGNPTGPVPTSAAPATPAGAKASARSRSRTATSAGAAASSAGRPAPPSASAPSATATANTDPLDNRGSPERKAVAARVLAEYRGRLPTPKDSPYADMERTQKSNALQEANRHINDAIVQKGREARARAEATIEKRRAGALRLSPRGGEVKLLEESGHVPVGRKTTLDLATDRIQKSRDRQRQQANVYRDTLNAPDWSRSDVNFLKKAIQDKRHGLTDEEVSQAKNQIREWERIAAAKPFPKPRQSKGKAAPFGKSKPAPEVASPTPVDKPEPSGFDESGYPKATSKVDKLAARKHLNNTIHWHVAGKKVHVQSTGLAGAVHWAIKDAVDGHGSPDIAKAGPYTIQADIDGGKVKGIYLKLLEGRYRVPLDRQEVQGHDTGGAVLAAIKRAMRSLAGDDES